MLHRLIEFEINTWHHLSAILYYPHPRPISVLFGGFDASIWGREKKHPVLGYVLYTDVDTKRLCMAS